MLVEHGRNVRLRVLFFVFLFLFKVHLLMWQGLDTALLLPGKGNHSVAGSPSPQPLSSLSLPLTGQENHGKRVIQQFKAHSSPLLPSLGLSCINQQSPTFLVPGTSFKEDNFSMNCVGEQLQDDSSPLHLLCSLFLLLLHQLHFRSTGIRSQKLGTPGLNKFGDFKRDAQKLGGDTKHRNTTVLPFSSQMAPNPVPIISIGLSSLHPFLPWDARVESLSKYVPVEPLILFSFWFRNFFQDGDRNLQEAENKKNQRELQRASDYL